MTLVDKTVRIIDSCSTREHCVVAHNFIKLAEQQLSEEHRHIVNESYLKKILQVTGVIE